MSTTVTGRKRKSSEKAFESTSENAGKSLPVDGDQEPTDFSDSKKPKKSDETKRSSKAINVSGYKQSLFYIRQLFEAQSAMWKDWAAQLEKQTECAPSEMLNQEPWLAFQQQNSQNLFTDYEFGRDEKLESLENAFDDIHERYESHFSIRPQATKSTRRTGQNSSDEDQDLSDEDEDSLSDEDQHLSEEDLELSDEDRKLPADDRTISAGKYSYKTLDEDQALSDEDRKLPAPDEKISAAGRASYEAITLDESSSEG
mmetsp:Transcript_25312/g.38383  ORF Transcript_25312/g.38383 Transcript_25312/m.38383 type:complete len:257 (+) Transcript_25312:269-1039(+)